MGRIRTERKRTNLTLTEFAQRVGLSKQAISQIELKDRGDWESLKRIAEEIAKTTNEEPAQVFGRFMFDQKAGAA